MYGLRFFMVLLQNPYKFTECDHPVILSSDKVLVDGLVIGFIAHLYNLLLHFTNQFRTQTSVLSVLQSSLAIYW
jgi:hypothetical protein